MNAVAAPPVSAEAPRSFLGKASSERWLIGLLFVSMFLDPFRLEVFRGLFNIRPSFVVFVIVMPVQACRWRVRREAVWRTPLLYPLAALNGVLLIATAVNFHSPYHLRGFITCILLAVNIGFYLLVYRYASGDESRLEELLRFVVSLAALFSIASVVVLFLYQVGFAPARYLMQLRSLGDWTMTNANTLSARPWLLDPTMASYLAAVGVMSLARAVVGQNRRAFFSLAGGAILVAVLLSYSRGAWVGFGLGILATVIVLIATRQRTLISLRTLALGLGLVVVASLAINFMVPTARSILVSRAVNALNIQRGTGHERLGFWAKITVDGLRSPLIGHGSDAYRALLPPPPKSCAFCGPYVAENATVEIFHGAGVLGLTIYLATLVITIGGAVRALRHWRVASPSQRGLAAAAVGGFVAIFVGSQVNPSFWGNLYWSLWAISNAALWFQPLSRAWVKSDQVAAL